jgi:RHS repeat-associated protein
MKKKPVSKKQTTTFKYNKYARFISILLAITIFTTSVPAAPKAVVDSGGEFLQDIRFAYLSSSLSAFNVYNLLSFLSPNSSSQTTVASIQVFPGDVTVKQGEKVTFSAISFDSANEPIGGIDLDWEATDVKRGVTFGHLQNSTFEAKYPGTFYISAKSNGQKVRANITVLPSAEENPDRAVISQTPTGIISSRSGIQDSKGEENSKKDEDEKSNKGSSGQIPEAAQNLLPEEGYWNNGNWQSADDPGNQTGNPTGSPADDGAGSGNFQISAPVVSLPGRGIDLALNLNYNSRLWNKSLTSSTSTELTYDIDRGFPAPGWSLGFGKILDMGSNGGSMLIDADGTRHGYSGLFTPGSSIFHGYTVDGKFINYESSRDSSGIYSGRAWFPNGTTIIYGAKNDGAVYPTRITDAQGNQILITYVNNQGPALQTITDTIGRVITFQYDSLGRLLSAQTPGMQGEVGSTTRRTLLQLHYKPLALNYSFGAGVTPVIRNPVPQYLIDSVYYPSTNTGYWFGDTDSYSSYGMLAKVIEQRGMSWATGAETQGVVTGGQMTKQALYNYPLTAANEAGRTNGIGLTDAPTYTNLTENWDGMDVAENAVTNYFFDNNTTYWDGASNSPARMVRVTQPNGSISKQYSYRTPNTWTDGLVFADETFVPENLVTPVSSSRVGWQQGDYDSPRPFAAEIYDENSKKVRTEYSYANGLFNQITRSCDYDNAGTLLKCANAVYENSIPYKGTWNSVVSGNQVYWYFSSGRHIFNLLKTSNVENPDGTIASRTDYEYDNYQSQPLVNTPGVIKHDPVSDPFTTQLQNGSCLVWQPSQSVPSCSFEGEEVWVPTSGGYYDYCQCQEFDQVSVYDPATDKRGNLTKQTTYADAQNATGAIENKSVYDITGNLVKSSTSCCEQTSIEYNISNQFAYPISQTRGSSDPNSPDRITTYSVYNFETGLMKQGTDANGRTSVTNFNPATLRPVKSISSTGAYTAFAYDDTAMTTAEEAYESTNVLSGKSVKYLNGIGKVRREEALGANNVWDFVEIKYNKLGEVWKQSRPFRTGETPIFSENIYDSQGRTKQVIEPDGSISKAFYNEATRPDSATSATTGIGNTTRVADAWGRERWGRYDQQGRLAEVVEPNPNGNGSVLAAGSLKTTYKYDTLGRMIETEQGTQRRFFKYDSLGRLIRQKMAEQTATLDDNGVYIGAGNAGSKWSESFIYDNRSNLVQKTDARNVKSNYSYIKPDGSDDALNRIRQVSYDISGATNVLHAPGVTYSYMTAGDKSRIQQIRTDGILTENYSYDVEGRVADFTQTVDARTSYPMTTSYLYDSLDRAKEIRHPAQYGLSGSPRKIIEPTYDTASRLTTLKVNGVQQAGNIVYNSSDQTESIKIGTVGTNQVTETYTYNQQNGLLTNQKVTRRGATLKSTTLLDLSYDYNRNNSVGNENGKTGHLTKITDNLNTAKNKEYEYDGLGRLTKAKGGTTGLWTQQYSYDRFGNRLNVVATGNGVDNLPMQKDGTPNLTYDNLTNRITNAGVQYDVAGNQTRALAEDGVTWLKYLYDGANRLQIITKDDGTYQQAFQFGSSNQRLMDYDYISGQFKIIGNGGAIEYNEFTSQVMTWTKSYVYLGERLLSTMTPNGSGGETTEFNHPDRLGTRLTTSQQNGTYSQQTSLPFGTALASETTPNNNTKKFTSYERSARTGLDYAVNRTYDSKLGRFTQVDPIGMGAANLEIPQTLNLYNYCGNDPINHTDPDGLFWGAIGRFFKAAFKWLAVAVAVAIAVLTVVFAPVLFTTSLQLVFGVISAVAGAASTVLNAFGLSKAAAIFGIVAAFASFGSSLIAARSSLNWKTILATFSSGATAVSRTLTAFGYRKLGQIFGLVAGVTEFISGGLKPKNDTDLSKGFKFQVTKFEIYKFARSTAEQTATIFGATRVAGYLNVLGIAEDVVDYYNFGKKAISLPPNDVKKLLFLKNIRVALTGDELTRAQLGIFFTSTYLPSLRTQFGRINNIIGRVERGIALGR